MSCNDIEKRLLTRDRQEPLPPAVVSHLDECPKCRRLAEQLGVVEEALLLPAEADQDLVESTMARIAESEAYPTRTHSLAGWFFGGLPLVAALIAVRQSVSFRFLLGSVLGPRVELSVTFVIGILLVAYLAVFVLANGPRLEETVHRLAGRQ